MNIKEVEYQKKAVKELQYKANMYLNLNKGTEKAGEILLHSPVASGKTVISGLFMDNMLAEIEEKNETVAFIWISTGKGNLHNQSKESISKFTSSIETKTLNEVISNGKINHRDTVFLNWESVRNKDNVVRRAENNINLESCLSNTEIDNIIILIDEAHESRNTDLAEEVLKLFTPNLIINITATPKDLQNFIDLNTVKIDIKDVVAEGFIKNEILVNCDVDTTDRDELLTKAIEKLNSLKSEYIRISQPTIPLCLIQIENELTVDTENGKITNAEEIKNMLLSKGIPNEKIGIWVSNKAICQNLEDIKNSEIEYLIFKQAIATGWDCPRSQILVRFREIKSITFDIQTIGRILRTVNKEHYNNDLLDKAYIYTETETIDFNIEVDSNFKRLIKQQPDIATIKDRIGWEREIKIPKIERNSLNRTIVDSEKINLNLDSRLYELFKTMEVNPENLKTNKLSGIMTVENIVNILEKTENQTNVNSTEVELTDNQIQYIYRNFLSNLYPKYSIGNYIPTLVRKHYPKPLTKKELYKLIVSNSTEIKYKVTQIVKELEKETLVLNSTTTTYKIPELVMYSDVKEANHNYLYTKEPNLDVSITKSATEELFANYLNSNPNVSSWYKNGTGNKDFCVTYHEQDVLGNYIIKEYYPDFIIFSKTKKLYILDTKSKAGDKDFTNTRQKYNVGKNYEIIQSSVVTDLGLSGIEFSIVKDFQGLFKLCTSTLYDEDITSQNWETLNIV